MAKAVFWFRRDLRLNDNAGLDLALKEADEVICLYVLDPQLTDAPDQCPARLAFLYSCLADLDANLQKQGGRLIVRRGEVVAEIQKVLRESGAATLYHNRDYTPFARKRDGLVEASLKADGFQVKTAKDLVFFEGDEILTGNGTPYTVYTPYKKRWLERINQERLMRFEPDFSKLRLQSDEGRALASLPIPAIPAGYGSKWFIPGGETAARARLKDWAGVIKDGAAERPLRIEQYAEQRNFPAVEGTSRLSPFIRFGAISPRTCYRAAVNARERAERVATKDNCDTWIGELIWRDFYWQILWNFPHVAKGAFQAKYNALAWEHYPEKLAAWQEGRTGYPIVDAAMRQLNDQNWMHNRLRMITASFLVKDLLINWQVGERHFWRTLVDGDQPSNNGGWQWSASTGTDAQPFFRVFSPVSQSQKFDPEGEFIRRYVPELAKVPAKFIHEPWKMTPALQTHLGCVIGKDYPAPIVDHAEARQKAIALFK